MLDFLKNKKETEIKVDNRQNDSTPTNIDVRDKWMKVYIKTLERYPNIKCWLDFKATGFVKQCDDYMFPNLSPKKHQDIEDYIEEVTGMAESINNQVMENLESFKEFIQNHSPRFVTVGAIPGLGLPEREYPYLYYATDFEIEEFDSKYNKQVLKFYGMDGFNNGFTSVFVFPTAQVIRNMTREEFDKFLGQKLSSVNLTPWDFDEYKKKWIELYEGTTEPQVKTDNETIFKKGDFLKDSKGNIFICNENVRAPLTYLGNSFCVLSYDGTCFIGWEWQDNLVTYANKEEKQKLIAAIGEKGYIWDSEKLELRKK